VAVLATEGVEEVELTKPKKALEDAGALVDVICPKSGLNAGKIKAWDVIDWGDHQSISNYPTPKADTMTLSSTKANPSPPSAMALGL